MTGETIKLASDFPAAGEAEWRALAGKALKGASPDQALTSDTDEGLSRLARDLYLQTLATRCLQ